MRVAIFHDYLNQFGGAERVLNVLLDIFPEADLYTLLYDENKTKRLFEGRVKGVSFLDKNFIRSRHRMFIPIMPFAAGSISINGEYDLVLSSSAGYAKGFGGLESKNHFHICYCHSPLRYAWEIDYLKDLPNAPWPLTRFFAEPIAKTLKSWDYKASKKVNVFVANSYFISQKIKSYYERDSHVIYPPVDSNKFYPEKKTTQTTNGYYLMVGRLLYYKMFSLGIEAFNKLNKNLKIIGSGPEFFKLRRLAGPKIEFLKDIDDEQLRLMYTNAEGLVFPQIEDFGLVAAEAQSCGAPVVAYNAGGAKEIVEDGKTGTLFDAQTVSSLVSAIEKNEKINFDREYIAKKAEKFSEENFKRGMKQVLRENGIIIS